MKVITKKKKSNNSYINELIKMISLLKKRKWLYFFSLILGCTINVTSNILSAFVNRNMIKAAESGSWNYMIYGIVLALIAFFIGFLVFPFCIYLKVRVIKHAITGVKLELFKHTVDLPVAYLDNRHSGELTSRLINDVNVIENALNDDMQMVGVSVIGGICSMVLMMRLDWRLAILTILIGIISARINIAFSGSLRELGEKIQKSLGILNQHLGDITAGYKTARIYNVSSVITGRYININNSIASSNNERSKKASWLNSLNYLLGVLSMAGIYIVGIGMVSKDMVDFSTVVAIVGLQKGVNFMFSNFGRFFSQLQGALAGAGRVYEILEQQLEPEKSTVKTDLNSKKMIDFRDINFAYENRNNVIINLNMNAAKGNVIALTGASGAGKSTIIKLLLGFYPPNSGDIFINGSSTGQYSLKELREMSAYVPQDAYLFHGTIEENIRYGRMTASEEELMEAAKKANAYHFIVKMPEGFKTTVEEGGVNLSGGQRQCIALARAFVKKAPILLLDEATSALDSKSEQLVQKGLSETIQGKTAIIIAHRMSTLKAADKVCVLREGRIFENNLTSKEAY